ncbi:MAG: helix-turn-helix domain-containing protein [Flavisolibacter sp.]
MNKLTIENISLEELREMIGQTLQAVIKAQQPEEFLTIEEASEFTRIPVTTIYDYTSRRNIPFHKKGKKLLFIRQELSQWLKSGQTVKGGDT